MHCLVEQSGARDVSISDIDSRAKSTPYRSVMTVANIRKGEDDDFVEVLFLESARFYRLLKKNPAYDTILRKLEKG